MKFSLYSISQNLVYWKRSMKIIQTEAKNLTYQGSSYKESNFIVL